MTLKELLFNLRLLGLEDKDPWYIGVDSDIQVRDIEITLQFEDNSITIQIINIYGYADLKNTNCPVSNKPYSIIFDEILELINNNDAKRI